MFDNISLHCISIIRFEIFFQLYNGKKTRLLLNAVKNIGESCKYCVQVSEKLLKYPKFVKGFRKFRTNNGVKSIRLLIVKSFLSRILCAICLFVLIIFINYYTQYINCYYTLKICTSANSINKLRAFWILYRKSYL